MRLFRTLHARFAVTMALIFLTLTAISVWIAFDSSRRYQQEVAQRLNLDLAEHIVHGSPLIANGDVDAEALDHLFHSLMVTNPSIEVYLLDNDGKVLAYSAPPGHVRRERVSLEPVRRLLADTSAIPLLGDDPRSDDEGGKVFSVARVEGTDGSQEGYLYVILASEQYDSVAEVLGGSQILKVSTGVVVASVIFAFIATLLSFGVLTRRLRALVHAVERFRDSDFSEPIPDLSDDAGGDEIDRLSSSVRGMSLRILEQVARLRKTDQLRRELVANISHDLRTPLAALQGYIDTLQLKGESLTDEERERFLEIASRHGGRLGRLIDDLFELSKLEANDAEPHFESCAMGELVHDVVHKFQLTAESKGVSLAFEIPRDLPPAKVDIGLMERVLENLIDNAIRYTPSGGEVVVRVVEQEGELGVEISDTGVGISAEDLSNVFERFYRAGGDGPNRPEGTGLGLAIAKRIVELHGSSLEIASALDRGTTFSFRSPLSEPV